MTTSTSWDAEQRAVVELDPAASGTVIGAPGSGKTAVVVERVARLLTGEAALAPEAVLALTPSRASATRLRDRLGLRVGIATPGALARSIGSFAFQVVRADALSRGEAAPQLLTGAEQDRLLGQLVEGDIDDERIAWPEHLPPVVRRSREFRSELRAFLDAAVELDVSRDELRAMRGGEWAPVASLLADYAGAARGMRDAAWDAAELTRGAIDALRSGAPLPGVDELRAVLVDDAQELTRGGALLLEALAARGVAVVAFGDPDIASGAFRGITPDIFGDLQRALGPVHVLRGQHRARGGIAWVTRSITQLIGAGGRVDHRHAPGPRPDDGGEVAVAIAPSPHEEIDEIAWQLREWHLSRGVAWSRMAVVAHDTRQIATLEAELAAREVPTRAAGVTRPLGSERSVRQIVELVLLGLTPAAERSDEALVDALRSPYGGFDGVALRRLRARLRHAELAAGGVRPARELLREAMAHPVRFAALDTAEGRSAERLAVTLREIGEGAARGATIHELLWLAWDRSRTLAGRRLSEVWRRVATSPGPQSAETARVLDGLVALFAAAKLRIERAPHEGPLPFVREILGSDVPEDMLSAPERDGFVTLLTPANALSTEFDVVVIAGLQDGVWPNTRLRGGMLGAWRLPAALRALRSGDPDPDDDPAIDRRRAVLFDELRLFVRAVSRARIGVLVTATRDDDHAPSPLFASLPDERPLHAHARPLTLRGLVAHHRRTLTTSGDEAERREAAGQLRVLAEAGVPGADPGEWYGIAPATTEAPLRDLAAEPVRVSPSRIEGFEECGLSWAIASLGGDTVTSPSAGLGTILHAALEHAPDGGVDALERVVDERWGELDFETAWLGARERRRMDQYVRRLDSYLASVRADGGRVVASEAEFRFAVSLDDGAVHAGPDAAAPGRAVIRGTIDRVEQYPPGAGEHPLARGRGYEAMAAAPDGAIVVADLKTGKNEERTADAKVRDDAQLAAYQLAVEAGLVAGAPPERLGGARLVVVSKTTAKSPYRVAHQHTLAGDDRDAFLARLGAAARGMAASTFEASVEAHCTAGQWAPICRIHTVKAVSA